MFDYEFLNGFFDNFLVGESQVFVDFSVKGGVRKLPNCFLLVEAGASDGYCAAFVSCCDQRVSGLIEVIPVFEIYESRCSHKSQKPE